MNLSRHGKNIFQCEVSNISLHGFWILLDDEEYFVSFQDYPDFLNAKIPDIYALKFSPPNQLRWDTLDIDIELESLKNPESFPVLFKR